MPKSVWKQDDPDAPLSQGDLLVVAWAKTIAPDEVLAPSGRHPVPGARDAFDLPFWDDSRRPDVLEMWGRANYGLAVVIAEGCAIDKEFNILREGYLAEGYSEVEATNRALEEEEAYVSVAEAWPVEALPAHLQEGASNGAVGYLPFTMGDLVPDDRRSWVVDLNRVTTVGTKSIHHRIGIADGRWVLRLQSAICRHFAARTIRVSENLADLFSQPLTQVEALTAPSGNPPRVRARLHFENRRKVDLEAILTEVAPEETEEARHPGFRGRG